MEAHFLLEDKRNYDDFGVLSRSHLLALFRSRRASSNLLFDPRMLCRYMSARTTSTDASTTAPANAKNLDINMSNFLPSATKEGVVWVRGLCQHWGHAVVGIGSNGWQESNSCYPNDINQRIHTKPLLLIYCRQAMSRERERRKASDVISTRVALVAAEPPQVCWDDVVPQIVKFGGFKN